MPQADGDTAGTSLSKCLSEKKVPAKYSTDPQYADLAEPFNLRLPYKPVTIVLPTKNQHVKDAVLCAGKFQVKVQARSGGHSYASFSSGGKDGSMVINLEPLQTIKLDNRTGIATVGGGVRLGNLAQGIWDQGKRGLSHGTCTGVGIGGHFTHGGYGHTSRNWGLALDHIVAVDVVLADGSLKHASQTENSELYWALRGAADSFGIITTFYLQTNPAPASVTYFSLQWADTLYKTKDTFVNTFLHIQEFAKNASVVDNRISFGINLNGVDSYNLGGTFFGSVDEFNAKIKPEILRSVPQPPKIVTTSYDWIGYLTLMSDHDTIKVPLTGYDEHDNFFAKSLTVPEHTPEAGLTSNALGAFYDHIKVGTSASWFVIINLYGGPGSAINTKDTSFAAYNRHDSLWVLQNYGVTAASIPFINGINDVITKAQPQTEFGAYLNYVDPSYDATTAHKLYYGEALYAQLEPLKKKYDPNTVFWNPQAIGTN
ncbi:hypothetical protein BDV95DRAFT_506587 [Massariosphaeria phaeospora]|uniref:FAD-binding PCMH-type domain-containing protein n=1 Tax=Massariosphaeria phaeospora TaxID=100035 RepID=A0A7C8I2Y8_9PLEO|nr:hypothetical protein BDV95DRAFT_506587 [Massariosphaeria phaeospora]